MSNVNKDDCAQPQPRELGSSVSSRRKILAAGAAGSVLASIKSGSALASGVCIGPSAFTSIAASKITGGSHAPVSTTWRCSSHGYYMNNAWPNESLKTQKVKDVFGKPTQLNFGVTDNTTLYQVINTSDHSTGLGTGEKRALASDLISAYLDAHNKGSEFPYKQSDIKAMWNFVFLGVPYLPNWTSHTVRDFLDVLVSGTGL